MKKVKHFITNRLLGDSSLVNEDEESNAVTSVDPIPSTEEKIVEIALVGVEASGKSTLVKTFKYNNSAINCHYLLQEFAEKIREIVKQVYEKKEKLGWTFESFYFEEDYKESLYRLWWDPSFQDILLLQNCRFSNDICRSHPPGLF